MHIYNMESLVIVYVILCINKGIFVHVDKENLWEEKNIDADSLYNEFVKLLKTGTRHRYP